jgi:23S rRNA (cytosine1962-C5)-methyltransferase
MLEVVLKPGRDRSVRRRHPWVLSGSVDRATGGDAVDAAGGWARVVSANGEVLGFGHYSPESSLRVRLLSFGKAPVGDELIDQRVAEAVALRDGHPLLQGTDSMRLVNAEADGLPGLLVDRYGDVVVAKFVSAGMAVRRERIAEALRATSTASCGFERADSTASRREGLAAQQGALWGELPGEPFDIDERGRRYRVDVVNGQKTGFYLDQRDSRDLVQSLASGRRVLDLFAYTGGFSVAAARGGAASVTAVESSARALELAAHNVAANAPAVEARFEQADVHDFLRGVDRVYDLIVVDPPPLARHKRDVTRASRAYKDALLYALRRAAPRARLLAFACSHTIGPELFAKIAFGASLDANRPLQILRVLSAPPDHPVSLDHPEGAYLTGLLLQA